ncbi:MAG: MFS transporter [Opitutae bacterium]|nr:MFS transporter [Opitutae bacterium]
MAQRSHLRWAIIGLIAVATVINYVDRTSLAVMWPSISADTNLSKSDYANIVSAFMVCYALGQAVSGRIFDRVGTRFGFVLSVTVWSLACAGHALARSLATLSLARGILGFSEAGNWPGATKAVAEWFPRNERALAQGIFNAGASLGAVVSAPLIALLFAHFGWRATFVIVGALGFIWLVPWLILARSTPDKHPWVSPEERAHILGERPANAPATGVAQAAAPAASLRSLLEFRATWGVIVSRFFLDPIWWLFVNWLPIYLADRFGFDVKSIGLFAWVPYVGAVIGSLSGGWMSGHLIGRGWSVDKARKRVILLGGVLTLPGFLAGAFAPSPIIAVLAIAVVLCGFQVMINNIQTLPSDFFAGSSVGTVAGVGGMSAVLGVLVFSTWLVPALSRISYVPVFLMGTALVPLGIAAVFVLCGTIRRLDISTAVSGRT